MLPHRALLVEDNLVNQKVALRYLARVGLDNVTVANDGVEAAAHAIRSAFDIIFMDCHMPNMDGYEATAAIRSGGKNVATPIVAMTARAMEGDRARCLDAGMNDYLTKPLTNEALERSIGTNLARLPRAESDAAGLTPLSDGPPPPDQEKVAMMHEDQPPVDASATLAEGGPAWSHAEDQVLSQIASAPVDLAHIEANTEGDGDFARELVELYLGDALTRLSALDQALSDGDARTVQLEAHTIKGASANVGATGLAELASTMEEAAKDGMLEDKASLRFGMVEEYGRVRVFFERYLEEMTDRAGR